MVVLYILLGLAVAAQDVDGASRHARQAEREACSGVTCDHEVRLKGWLSELCQGLWIVPKVGLAMTLLTYGDNAFPVLNGNGEKDSFIAFAELGNGRVVAIARHSYLWDFYESEPCDWRLAKLHLNLKRWMTLGTYTNDSEICEPKSSADLSTCLADTQKKIVMWKNGDWPDTTDNDNLQAWVQNGGSLIHGFSKPKWESDSNGKSVMEGGFIPVVHKAGIAYTTNVLQANEFECKTDSETVSTLVGLNTQERAKKVTFENLAADSFVQFILEDIKWHQAFYPRNIATEILRPFEVFARQQEGKMNWPVGSYDDPQNVVDVSPEQHVMFKLYHALASQRMWWRTAPRIWWFPGNYNPWPETKKATFTYESKANTEIFSTGFYLIPGKVFSIKILNDENDYSWRKFQIIIGSHTDNLEELDKLARWPLITRQVQLVDRFTTVRWMFGGLISIKVHAGVGNTLKIELDGVTPTPYYNLEEPDSIANWNASRSAPGHVADIRGKRVRFTVQSTGIRNLADPGELLRKWDSAVEKAYRLFGYPETTDRSQWFTADIQLTGGVMHSGVPIVGQIGQGNSSNDYGWLNGKFGNHWGSFHEIGHNLGDYKWTWFSNGEVVVNLIGMLNVERLSEFKTWPIPKIDQNIRWFLDDFLANPTYDFIQESHQAHLIVYSQMVRDFGWACQRQVFVSYQADEEAGTNLPYNDSDKINQWVLRYSLIVNYNLVPLFSDFWQWPLSMGTKDTLSSLTPYFPDDVVTQDPAAQSLVADILSKYTNIVRTVTITPNCPAFVLDYMN